MNMGLLKSKTLPRPAGTILSLAAAALACAAPHKPGPAPDYEAVRRRAEAGHEEAGPARPPEPRGAAAPRAEAPRAAEPASLPVAASAPVKERSGGRAPDWTEGRSADFPREAYMTGAGSADDRPTAEDRARGEIVRVFQTVVSVETSAHETESAGSQGGGGFSREISQAVKTTAQKVLEGVEIREHWKDPATGRHHALAVLERGKAMTSVKERLADLDRQAAEWKKGMETGDGRLERVKAAMRLLSVLKARAELNGELRVLDPEGRGSPAPVDEAQVRPAAARATAALEVVLDIHGAGASRVETGVVQGLVPFGLQARTSRAGAPDVLIEGTVETKELAASGEGWKWARSTATVSLKDARSDKTFLRFDASERQASSDPKEAARRSLDKLAAKLSIQVGEAIASYFTDR